MMTIASARRNTMIEPTMVTIPEGWFLMGCETGRDDERPVHRVWVDTFALGACQVTNAEYDCFVAATGHAKPFSRDELHFQGAKHPVVSVSWFDAADYCAWLTRETGKNYRLPTEAEWERAARGGMEGRLYPWGDDGPEHISDYATRWKNGPEDVGLYPPNAYGLFNVGDNVHEWCADWYDAGYYERSPEKNPQGPSSGSRRASRGGSWRHHIKVTRTAARSSIPPDFKYADYGFRVVRSTDIARLSDELQLKRSSARTSPRQTRIFALSLALCDWNSTLRPASKAISFVLSSAHARIDLNPRFGGEMRNSLLGAKYGRLLRQILVGSVLVMFAGALCAGSAEAQKQKKKKGQHSSDESSESLNIPIPDDRAIDIVISEMLGAWQLGDVAALHKSIADDVVVVSGAWEPPVAGWDNYAKAYQRQRDRTQNVVLERTNTLIKVLGNVGWASYQWEFRGVVDGSPTTVRGQTSLVLEKQKERWVIIHNHTSLAQEMPSTTRGSAPVAPPSPLKPPAGL